VFGSPEAEPKLEETGLRQVEALGTFTPSLQASSFKPQASSIKSEETQALLSSTTQGDVEIDFLLLRKHARNVQIPVLFSTVQYRLGRTFRFLDWREAVES
jgi:hypothetical protein